jgi:AraC family transcriptional regulator of adaptative response/methylated-DNA-[protein]-cysteine methyltransferase
MSKSLRVRILPMSGDGLSSDGRGPDVRFSFFNSTFGECIVASTSEGICHLAFCSERARAVDDLKVLRRFGLIREESDPLHLAARVCMSDPLSYTGTIQLHLAGTAYQIRVWEELLKIPFGGTTSYGRLAKTLGDPRSSRAVGAAVGRNPVAYIVPCHRVLHSDGGIGNYMWGSDRKREILAWEAGHFGLFS